MRPKFEFDQEENVNDGSIGLFVVFYVIIVFLPIVIMVIVTLSGK